MFISNLCPPAIIFIGYQLIQIFIDFFKGTFNKAFINFIVMIVFSIIINILCNLGYSVIAWFLVFIPIIMMSVITALLLRVFGTNPDEDFLKSKIKRSSDISGVHLDPDGDQISGTQLLNQQKYAYLYDKFNSVKRIDRDKIRTKLYHDVDEKLNLRENTDFYRKYFPMFNNDEFDLSRNPIKYNIMDSLINKFGENFFLIRLRNLYNSFEFKQLDKSDIIHPYASPFVYEPGTSTMHNIYNPEHSIIMNDSNSSMPSLNQNYKFSIHGSDESVRVTSRKNFNNYSDKYDTDYLSNGFLLFQRHKFNKVQRENPNATDVSINKLIEKEWNELTAEQQHRWNNNANRENARHGGPSYNPDTNAQSNSNNRDNVPCPSNETPNSFKARTGFNCFESCPPGKQRNSLGNCVNSCPDGMERITEDGLCRDII